MGYNVPALNLQFLAQALPKTAKWIIVKIISPFTMPEPTQIYTFA